MFSQFDQRLAALEEQHKDVVSRLQESHFQVSCLRGEILELREENAKLRNGGDAMALHDEVLKLQEQNKTLENEISAIPVLIGCCGGTERVFFVHRDITYSDFFNRLNNLDGPITFYVDSLMFLKNIKNIDIKDFAHSSTGNALCKFKILASGETGTFGDGPQFWLLPITHSVPYGPYRLEAIRLFKKCGIELNWPLTDVNKTCLTINKLRIPFDKHRQHNAKLK